MAKKYWLICNICGYSKEIFTAEEVTDDVCPICKDGQMILDMNAGRKITEEPIGDNIPIFDQEKQTEEINRLDKNLNKLFDIRLIEQEITNSVNNIGEYSVWEMIEVIVDPIIRLRYRFIYLKLGYKIPERG